MKDKTIYMELGDEQTAHHQKEANQHSEKPLKDYTKDKIKDQVIDSLTSNLQILDVTGTTAVVTIPLEVVKLMSVLSKELENQLENYEKGVTR